MPDNPMEFSIETPTEPTTKRRGRPPGSKNRPTASAQSEAANLKQALATLNSFYSFMVMGLTMAQLPETAAGFMNQTDDLMAKNEEALKAAPKLARYIANVGTAGGASVFFIANGMAFYGVYRSAVSELTQNRLANEVHPEDVPGGV